MKIFTQEGQSLVELLVTIGIAAILFPALIVGLIATRNGKAQENQRTQATALLEQSQEIIRVIREKGWSSFATDGTFHPVTSGNTWSLASGSDTVNGLTRQIVISDVYRATPSGTIISDTNGWIDPSTKKATVTVSWTDPLPYTITSDIFLTRYLDNLSLVQTSQTDFASGSAVQTQVTNTSGGEVTMANNTKGKWCSPSFSPTTIDLPDGPPVAVAATASAITTAIPNDVYVATAPATSSAIKLAYVTVSANVDPPISTLSGTFTLDPTKYSNASYVPTGINLTNAFKTNDVKYYTSAAGKKYALLATDLPDHEIVVVQVNDGSGNAYQDPTNHIYKYWTFFNTRMYPGAYNNPLANSPDSGGDGNGFQTNPTNAYLNDGTYAVDSNSGNGNSTSCTGADKDKHRFYDYGFTIPSGATINGISVNLAAKVDSTTGSPKMCVQLSWDGGTTWTTAQSTNNLTTSEATYALGGSADTWGHTWSTSDVSDTNFRLRVIDVASNTSRSFSLDWVGAQVYANGTTSSSNDQAPFGYGAPAMTIMGNTGYVDSGGYLYTFDLSNIDSKSPTNELDQIGCRVLIEGYDCKPGSPNGVVEKYVAGETGASWSDVGTPSHNTCADGGNIELNADHQLSAVQVGANKYIYVAVGAVPASELDIVDVSTPPTGSNLTSNACGRGGNTGWKVTGSLDFDPASGTEEAANSVYVNSLGTRAYMSSNGGIIHNGIPDSDQFYILDTTNKSSPKFLSTWPSTQLTPPTPTPPHYAGTAETGYYNGNATNIELYPRRALTVLDGQRAIIVGQDGIPNDGIEPQEYQVLDLTNEATPTYCGGLNFSSGFNDLTSVSEADFDNFVYMVANTPDHQLKIIQGGPDGTYVDHGTFVSSPIDIGYSTVFNHYAATITTPANTSLQLQFAGADQVNGSCTNANYVFTGPDGSTSTYYTATTAAVFVGTPVNGYKNPARCFKYKAYLTTTDYNATPVLSDMTINYSP